MSQCGKNLPRGHPKEIPDLNLETHHLPFGVWGTGHTSLSFLFSQWRYLIRQSEWFAPLKMFFLLWGGGTVTLPFRLQQGIFGADFCPFWHRCPILVKSIGPFWALIKIPLFCCVVLLLFLLEFDPKEGDPGELSSKRQKLPSGTGGLYNGYQERNEGKRLNKLNLLRSINRRGCLGKTTWSIVPIWRVIAEHR